MAGLAQSQVGLWGCVGEQENLLRFWVMPTQEVPSSGWAGLWVVLCFEVWSHWDWWHQESGRVRGTWPGSGLVQALLELGRHLFPHL